jgi:hypothetical protein
MQISARIEKFGVPYTGNIVVRSVITGGLLYFFDRIGTGRNYSNGAKEIVNGNAVLEVLTNEDVAIESEDGSIIVLVSGAGVVSNGPIPSTVDPVTLDAGWTGTLATSIVNDLLVLRGKLTAGAGAGSSILHLSAGFKPIENGVRLAIVNDIVVGVNSNTTGYIRLSANPTEADVVEFPGTII